MFGSYYDCADVCALALLLPCFSPSAYATFLGEGKSALLPSSPSTLMKPGVTLQIGEQKAPMPILIAYCDAKPHGELRVPESGYTQCVCVCVSHTA